MANATVLTNVILKVNSVDLSDHVTQVEVKQAKEKVECTAMGASAKTYIPGLGDDSITVTFNNDFAVGKVNATLQPLFASSSAFPIQVIPAGTAVSATNPSFSGTVSLYDYTPLSGKVGDLNSMDGVEFTNANQLGIVMGTV